MLVQVESSRAIGVGCDIYVFHPAVGVDLEGIKEGAGETKSKALSLVSGPPLGICDNGNDSDGTHPGHGDTRMQPSESRRNGEANFAGISARLGLPMELQINGVGQ